MSFAAASYVFRLHLLPIVRADVLADVSWLSVSFARAKTTLSRFTAFFVPFCSDERAPMRSVSSLRVSAPVASELLLCMLEKWPARVRAGEEEGREVRREQPCRARRALRRRARLAQGAQRRRAPRGSLRGEATVVLLSARPREK